MKHRIYSGFCLGFAALCAMPLRADDAPAVPPVTPPTTQTAVPDAAQITERWRAYFESLQSLRLWTYNAQMQLWERDAKQAGATPRLISDIKVRFAKAAPWFYREMQVRESAKAPYQFVALAYDGKKYQMAVRNPKPEMIDGHLATKLMLLSAKPFDDDSTTRLNFHLSLAMPFIFASDNVASIPFATLQKAEFWADVRKQITKVTPDTWEGHSGFTVTMVHKPDAAKKADDERMEIFMDDASGLPLSARNISNKTQKVIGEIKITALRAGENGAPAFPLRVELSGESAEGKNGKIAGTGVITVEPASVSMNAPMDSERFTIPPKSMEYVIENGKVVYSSFPKTEPKKTAKSPTKSHAKPK